jgi:hypothetical protein
MSDFDLLEEFSKSFELMSGGWDDAIGAIGGLVDAFKLDPVPNPADLAVGLKKMQDAINKAFDEWGKFFKEKANERARHALESQNEYLEKEHEYFQKAVLDQNPETDPQWAQFAKDLQDDYGERVRNVQKWLTELEKEVDEISEGFSEGGEDETEDVEDFDNSD